MSIRAQNLQIATTDTINPYNVRQAIIGGSNTTLNSNDTQSIGSSSLNVTLNPLAGRLFLKDNPVTIKENSAKAAVGTITALDLSRGVVELQVAGVYTLDTTANIRNRLYDASGTAFVGSPRPMFEVTFYNTSGGNVTINSGTGQTFTNVASISLSSGNSTTVKFWFTSATTMNVESVSASSGTTTLTSAGGTVSLVNDGAGPALANKGLTAGTGISLVDGGNQVTITNSSPATSVTLSNAVAPVVGEAGLVVDGTGPTLSIKKLVAGANVTLTNNVNDVTIAAAGGGGITEPLFTNINRAIISGRNNTITNVNTASYGTIIGGIGTNATIPVPFSAGHGGSVLVGGDGGTQNFSDRARGCVIVGSSGGSTYMRGDGMVLVGGFGNTNSQVIAGGSVLIGGYNLTRSIGNYGRGAVNIAAGGSILNNAGGVILIGGTNTTIGTTDGIVCVGASILTTTLNPSIRKTYIKDSPIYIKENAPKAVAGTILAADITKGVVELQAAGAYTLDTTVNIRNTLLDSTGAAFVGNIRPSFEVTFYNSSGGATTIATAAGQTLTNGVSPISIAAGESRTWKFWFTSATTMLIEDLLSSSAAGGGGITEPLFTSNNRAIISGLTNNFTNVNANSYGAVIGGVSNIITMPAFGGAGGGNTIVGGDTNTIQFGTNSTGSLMLAGKFNNGFFNTDGCAIIGGRSNTDSITIGSNGAVMIGGFNLTRTISTNNSYGAINICAGGTIISSSSAVLIGGTNTTVGDTDGIVCVGSSTLTTTLRPNTRKTFIKDSPVFIKENTTKAAGVITATEVSGGIIQLTAGAAFTLDTTDNIRNALLDSTGTAFVGNIRPSFDLIIYNSSGAGATVAAGAGQTFINVASPVGIPAGQSQRWTFWFTSATTILVHN